MFTEDELSEKGVYEIELYLLGMPIKVTVDDYLPYHKRKSEKLGFSPISDDHALWQPLLEKAAAKYMGSYEAINGGMEYTAFDMIVAAPYQEYWSEDYSVNELWDAISTADASGAMLTVGTYVGTGSD